MPAALFCHVTNSLRIQLTRWNGIHLFYSAPCKLLASWKYTILNTWKKRNDKSMKSKVPQTLEYQSVILILCNQYTMK